MSSVTEELEIFIHREGQGPQTVTVRRDQTLAEALAAGGINVGHDIHVFVGESTDLLSADPEEQDGEDRHAPCGLVTPAHTAGHGSYGHVHCHRCRVVAVTVRYQCHERRRKVSPATTVATLTQWAKRVFKLSGKDAEGLALQLCDTARVPDGDTHVGELTTPPTCDLCFDLVYEPKMQG